VGRARFSIISRDLRIEEVSLVGDRGLTHDVLSVRLAVRTHDVLSVRLAVRTHDVLSVRLAGTAGDLSGDSIGH